MRVAVFGIVMIATASEARADEPHFPRGTRTFQTYGGFLDDLGPQDVAGGFVSAGVGYYVFDNVSLSAELTAYGLSQPGSEPWAGAFGVVLRHHVLEFDRSSLFLDVAFAPFRATERVPPDGTHFNFVTQSGIGIAHELREHTNLLLGVRYIHLSNGQRKGDDRNPSLNGISAYVGVMFSF